MMKICLMILVCFVLTGSVCVAQDRTSQNDAQFKKWLKEYPDADTDKDGVLTSSEVRAYQQKLRGKQGKQNRPQPTHANVKYGSHRLQAFDIWLAKSKKPTPVVLYIHGGGFRGGDKNSLSNPLLKKCLSHGYSFASINYRMIPEIIFPIPMLDSARAIQLMRSRAKEWNLDTQRFASTGGSAGGGISLWLAFHDDLAKPQSKDLIARESTRLTCVAVNGAQSSYDYRYTDTIGVVGFLRHPSVIGVYGVKTVEELKQPKIVKLMEEMSPINHVTKDDAPALLAYSFGDVEVDEKTSVSMVVHHPRLGIVLKKKMDKLGIRCVVQYPGAPKEKKSRSISQFDFIKQQFEAK